MLQVSPVPHPLMKESHTREASEKVSPNFAAVPAVRRDPNRTSTRIRGCWALDRRAITLGKSRPHGMISEPAFRGNREGMLSHGDRGRPVSL